MLVLKQFYGDFAADNNATKLSFKTAASEAASEKMSLSSGGNLTGDIILDDGGSLKEAGGTAAFTFDGDGHVTKIGQDSQSSGQFLKWDGSKAVWDAASGGGGISKTDGVDNRVVTASSSSAVNGEANLTFDGSTLALTGDMTNDDLSLLSDSAILSFGAEREIKLTHVHNEGLTLKHTVGDDTPNFNITNR